MGKKALVTGASRGIGEAVARVLAREGYDLFLVCRNLEKDICRIRDELVREFGICCQTALCDVSDFRQVETMIKSAGEIHVLVNNAAVSHVGLLTDMTPDQWHQVMDTNLNSLFYICRLVVPQMVRRREGKIVNVSSVWGSVGASMEVAYSASKGGVNAFTKALAKELAPSNIQVNAIACGVIDTDMNKCFGEEEMNMLVQEIPADRLGRPEEVAALVVQLCTGNEYLTGQVITLDGGWT